MTETAIQIALSLLDLVVLLPMALIETRLCGMAIRSTDQNLLSEIRNPAKILKQYQFRHTKEKASDCFSLSLAFLLVSRSGIRTQDLNLMKVLR